MSFRQGDLVSAVDDYGRTVVGIASGDGATGYVTLLPSRRSEGGIWVQPPAVTVAAQGCDVVERAETLLHSKQLRDQAHAGRLATSAAEQRLRERARDDDRER